MLGYDSKVSSAAPLPAGHVVAARPQAPWAELGVGFSSGATPSPICDVNSFSSTRSAAAPSRHASACNGTSLPFCCEDWHWPGLGEHGWGVRRASAPSCCQHRRVQPWKHRHVQRHGQHRQFITGGPIVKLGVDPRRAASLLFPRAHTMSKLSDRKVGVSLCTHPLVRCSPLSLALSLTSDPTCPDDIR